MSLLFYTVKLVEAKEVVSYKSFNVRPALLHDENSQDKNLSMKKSEVKSFIICKGLSVIKNCFWPESWPLSRQNLRLFAGLWPTLIGTYMPTKNSLKFNLLSASPTKWSNLKNSLAVADELLKCVWPFCGVGR